MSVKVFVDLGSQPSRSVHWLCMLLRAPFELKALRLDKGENRTPSYLAIHPFGKVPAIQHNGETFIESNAILSYLCHQFDIAGSVYPKAATQRAKIDAYLFYHHEFRAGCAGWFQDFMKNKTEDLTETNRRLHAVLEPFETYWLGNYPFVQSNVFTIADMQVRRKTKNNVVADFSNKGGQRALPSDAV